jgi:hypothetical protein
VLYRLTLLFLSLSLVSGCSRYVVVDDDVMSMKPIDIIVPQNAVGAADKLQRYLKNRGRLQDRHNDSQAVMFVQPWVRDQSLRYQLLEFDERKRHLSEWKAQWTVQPLGRDRALVSLRVLEVIFVGPPDTLGNRPRITRTNRDFVVSDWFEAPPDHLRAALEARRFVNEQYPLMGLPLSLAALPDLGLQGPPKSLAHFENRAWQPLRRPRAF